MTLAKKFYFIIIFCEVLLQIPSVSLADFVIDEPFEAEELCCPSVGDPTILTAREHSVPWGDPFRAFKTAPLSVMVAPSYIPGAGYGIISQTFIQRYTWLGEYEGEVMDMDREDDISNYAWVITRGGSSTHFIDALNIPTSSYLRFTNCATNSREENVEAYLCRGRVYFMTFKDVAPGQELLIYYGDNYAESLGIDYKFDTQIS